MFVNSKPPNTYATGMQLNQNNETNDNTLYVQRVIRQAAARRYAHSFVSLPMYGDGQSGNYTDGYSADNRSYLMPAPDTLWIDQIYLDGYVAGNVNLNLFDVATGLAPTGITNPIVSGSADVFDIGTQVIRIPQNSTYRFRLDNAGGGFRTAKLDVLLNIKTDRFQTGAVDTLSDRSITLFTEHDAIDATTFNGNITALGSSASTNSNQSEALRCMFFELHDFSSTTSTNLMKWSLPETDGSATSCTIVRLDGYAVFASAAPAASLVKWDLLDNGGSSTGLTVSLNVAGQTFAGGTSTGSISTVRSGNPETNPANDYTLALTYNKTQSCAKAYAWLWVK